MSLDGLAKHRYWERPHDSGFVDALSNAGIEAFTLTTKEYDEARRPVVPDDLEDAPTRVISGAEKIAEDAYAYTVQTEQPNLSPSAQRTATKAGALLYPHGFATRFSAIQSADAAIFDPADYFDFALPFDELHARAAHTTTFLREPTTPRDEEFEQFTEAPHFGGSQSRNKDEIFVNIEPLRTPQTLFNAAYTRLLSLRATAFARSGSITHQVREGMDIVDSSNTGFKPVPAAQILQRGLLAYDALRMVESVDSAAAQALINNPEALPDQAYLQFIHLIAGIRPVGIRHGIDKVEKGLFRAGLDLSALRALAFTDNSRIYDQARITIANQATDSFGPEFLEMIDTVHGQFNTETEKSAFMRTIVTSIEQDQQRIGKKSPLAVGRVILHETVETTSDPDDPNDAFDYSVWSFTVPYAAAAIAAETHYEQVDPAGNSARLDRIETAVRNNRDFLAAIGDVYMSINTSRSETTLSPAQFTETEKSRF